MKKYTKYCIHSTRLARASAIRDVIPAIALTTLRLLGARLKPTRDVDRTRAKKRPIESKTTDVAAPKPEEAAPKLPKPEPASQLLPLSLGANPAASRSSTGRFILC